MNRRMAAPLFVGKGIHKLRAAHDDTFERSSRGNLHGPHAHCGCMILLCACEESRAIVFPGGCKLARLLEPWFYDGDKVRHRGSCESMSARLFDVCRSELAV